MTLALGLALAGCTVGAPPGFSSGDSWSAPLVAPLEDGLLLVPVKINDSGPYLFLIDPDSPVSSIDAGIRSSLDLYTVRDRDQLDERDHAVPVALAEVQYIRVGNLSVRNRRVRVHKTQAYWMGGRKIRGVLGRDVIADSLVFAADRDRGLLHIGKQGTLKPPPGATRIKFRNFYRRNLKEVSINGKTVTLHLDIGGHTSSMFVSKMKALGLSPIPYRTVQVDELATRHFTEQAVIADTLTVSGLQRSGVMFIPYTDRRVRDRDLDGTLGQNFLSAYNITYNWHKQEMFLSPRSDDAGAHLSERLRRFGPAFDGCTNPGCVSVKVEALTPPAPAPKPAAPSSAAPGSAPAAPGATTPRGGSAGAPPPPVAVPPAPAKHRLVLTREKPDIPSYEVLLEAVDPEGKPLPLPRLIATLPKGMNAVYEPAIDPNYAKAARLRVIDLGPFPRECRQGPHGVRCVWRLAKRQ